MIILNVSIWAPPQCNVISWEPFTKCRTPFNSVENLKANSISRGKFCSLVSVVGAGSSANVELLILIHLPFTDFALFIKPKKVKWLAQKPLNCWGCFINYVWTCIWVPADSLLAVIVSQQKNNWHMYDFSYLCKFRLKTCCLLPNFWTLQKSK